MDRNLNILCFSSTDWHGIWGSRQQVMRRLARRGHRVLFIERPIGLEHWLRYPAFRRRKWRRWRQGMQQVEPNLYIASLPLLLPGRYYATSINRFNQQLTRLFAQRFVDQLGLAHPLLWLYNPFQGALIGQFHERLSVYHCIDEWTAGTHGRKWTIIRTLENELLRKVDVVFANSPPLYAAKRAENAHTHRIPSGVDLEHFARATQTDEPIPAALAHIPPPRIGYSGHVNDRLDYAVLEALARARPDWSLVLIGDTHPWTPDAPPLRTLRAHANVHFLGKQPYAEMPAFLRGLDVCLMPYIDDDRGHYRSPLKLYEYLAAGKPVVSTPHPEVAEFADAVRQTREPHQFVRAVEAALAAQSADQARQRMELARPHSWDARVDEMEAILDRYLERAGRDAPVQPALADRGESRA
jgi:glycosyltransferase involved in cell wall biosynthesis